MSDLFLQVQSIAYVFSYVMIKPTRVSLKRFCRQNNLQDAFNFCDKISLFNYSDKRINWHRLLGLINNYHETKPQ